MNDIAVTSTLRKVKHLANSSFLFRVIIVTKLRLFFPTRLFPSSFPTKIKSKLVYRCPSTRTG